MGSNLNNYYENYNEESRLFRDNSHNIEWITSIHYLKNIIPPNSYIFDGCAGTGNYAFELARMGHKVVASDIVPHNVDQIKQKEAMLGYLEDIFIGDICEINKYDKETFDVVLCMGAFYHLNLDKREKAMSESLRVLKTGGLLVISYINNMAATLIHIEEALHNMDTVINGFEEKTFDNIFFHTTPKEMIRLANKYNTKIINHIAADGLNYLYGNKLNNASKENFEKYLSLHLKNCEDENLLGYSLHGLIFLEKL